MSSSKVSVVVRNMSESVIFLKKGMHLMRRVSTLPVPPTEIFWRWKQSLGQRIGANPYLWLSDNRNSRSWILMALAIGLLGTPRQHKTSCYPSMMFSHWMGMNLVALVQLSMRFESLTASRLRSSSGIFLRHCWRRCTPHSRICWMQGPYAPANHHGAMLWYW